MNKEQILELLKSDCTYQELEELLGLSNVDAILFNENDEVTNVYLYEDEYEFKEESDENSHMSDVLSLARIWLNDGKNGKELLEMSLNYIFNIIKFLEQQKNKHSCSQNQLSLCGKIHQNVTHYVC